MCLGILWGGIYDVSGWFCRILGPPDPNFALNSPAEACRCLGACKGRVGDLAVFGQFGVKNDPQKKGSKCVWGYFGGVFMMFSDGFDAFWALQTPIWVSDRLA